MNTTILLAGIIKDLQDLSNVSMSQVTEASQKAKESLTLTGDRAVNAIANSKHRVVDTLTQTSQQVNAALSETAHQTAETITTNTEKLKAYATAKVANVSDTASEVWQNPLSSWLDDWIHHHPRILWLVSHPLLSLGILLLAILMISGFLKALGQFFEKAWLMILQAPIQLSQVVFGAIYQSTSSLFGKNKRLSDQKILNTVDLKQLPPIQSSNLAKQERLTQILNRLEAINQEQKQLLQEVVMILSSDEVSMH